MIAGLSPATSALLADLVLTAHVAVVAFVVIGQLLFMAGGVLGWGWVRLLRIRLAHLALIAFVVLQSWWGATCPLTVWEQLLRLQAGQTGHDGSFIAYWLSRLIFFDAPAWFFAAVYSAFGALVLLTWWWIPPRRAERA